MYRNVRLRLTILFTFVTSALLTALLCVSFYLSAKQQFSLQLSSFTGQSYTVLESIREQNILTSQWLTAKEEACGFRIYLWDNGRELFHNNDHANRILQIYGNYLPVTSGGRSLRCAAGNSDAFIGSHGILPEILLYHKQIAKNNSVLRIYFIQSLEPLYARLGNSLLLYLLLFTGSECILTFFCWHFTGYLLRPLLDSQESQNRFISGVSHELRTPLAVILSSASACEKAPATQQKTFFQVIAREGEQMSSMLEQLLTLSRADSHSLPLQMEATDLQTLLLETYESFLPLAGESSHHLSIRLPEAEIPLCTCDPVRIRQVCHILLHNALSHTPAGSSILLFLADGVSETGKRNKTLKTRKKIKTAFAFKNGITIGVQDNGGGIPNQERERIFERFYQCPSSPKKGHHGLGLAVAKEIAAAHNGTLTVTDAPGGGALFLLSLPVLPLPPYSCTNTINP